MLYAWSGLFNVAASSGHWPITDWFLHWVMRNSVKTRSAFDSPKDARADQDLVSAAGHFAGACAACHGTPGRRPSPVMQAATPPAPDLAVNAKQWTDRQLYWILDHGVKFSGMPAWPARDRPDEIRRMVAFVRALPTMSVARYDALVGAAAGAGTTGPRGVQDGVLAGCAGCHGADGQGRGQPDIPILGGQRPAYLLASLQGYATGRRHSAVMGNAAAALRPEEMRRLAAHFAAMPGLGSTAPANIPAARLIVERGLPDRQLPACASCHTSSKPYPVLAGQRASYIAQRLRQWRGEKEVVDARKDQAVMPVIARRIPEEMIDPLARYLAGTR
ncbi:cytochrome c [Sphingomonas metalli]|uniref:Cytochrome c n=2 Tax=Sphingomonas metalli TaxID=1779358 RepID=A0A916WRN3_9SPHN|nr:cytochrome c [Sphingomonas metalli]